MSFVVVVGKDKLPVTAVELRPGEGVIFRLEGDAPVEAVRELNNGLFQALRGYPVAIFRSCCDGSPAGAHAEGCGAEEAEQE